MRRGFTLIELLIVMAILTVTMAIIVVSAGAVSATQLAMASKDSLRLMRYARNMALQTQQPITLTFEPGVITIASAFDSVTATPAADIETYTSLDSTDTPSTSSSEDSEKASTNKGSTLAAGDIEEVGLVKYYEGVAFEFIGFNDSIQVGRSVNRDKKDFDRRVAGEADEEAGDLKRKESDTFSVTVRANGTTRPFTIRIYDSEAPDDEGNLITVDFLCSATIGDGKDS